MSSRFVLIGEVQGLEIGVVLHVAFGDVVQLALRVDGAGIDVAQQDFEHENRARHLLHRADVELGRDFLVAGREVADSRIVVRVIERALRRVKNRAFGFLEVSQEASLTEALC